MTSKNHRNLLYLAMLSILPFPAQAADTFLEEVIVTARKRNESMQEVPVSVTAIAAELQKANIRDLRDLEGYSPNVTIDANGGGSGAATMTIRGVSYQEVDKSLDPSIGVVLDGVYLGTNVGQILENFDLERVEILRGPQGTLFGKNTIGGVINVIRNKPSGEFGGEVRVGTGSWGLQDIKGVVHFPIIKDKLAAKVYGVDTSDDGWVKNTTLNEDTSRKDYQSYGLSLLANPTEAFEIQFSYDRVKDRSDVAALANRNQLDQLACIFGFITPMWTPSDGCEAFDTGSDEDHVSNNHHQAASLDTDAYTLRMEWDIGPGVITSITGYRENDEYRLSEFDASAATFLYSEFFQDYEQTSQELNFTSTFSDTVEFVAGLYYWNAEYDQRQETSELWPILAGFPAGTTGRLRQTQETESYAAYFQGDWHISDAWTLTAGLRYTEEEKDFAATGQTFWLGGIEIVPAPVVDRYEDWSELTPKIGISYQHSEDVMLFASYAEGFKSGGFFGRNTDLDNLRTSYDPEYVNTFELGAKTEWLDRRLRINATLFYQEYEDKQEETLVQQSDGNVGTVVTNAASVELPGIELELIAALTENLRLRASYGYLDGEYDKYIGKDSLGNPVDLSGRDLRRAPKNTFGASATYNRNVGAGEIVADVSYRWRDEYEVISDGDPLGHVDAFGMWSASIDYIHDERYQLTLYGRNLNDERVTSVTKIGTLSSFGTWNQPRSWGAEFRYMF
ncbi:MAG: TonB-dependent receptor [Halieaceae bacterium]|jgi:iron complex outermembrane recepter protein|nr:TonB-dependent receptor [Halieaceae bacterium]